jgi:hypothetical protein
MDTCCEDDLRMEIVRKKSEWNGLDYVEVSEDQLSLELYFLGKLPVELREKRPGLERYLAIEGGERVRNIRILNVDPFVSADPLKDDSLVVRLDKYGDFSTYTIRLTGVANVDPRYDRVAFSFKINCPSDLDCLPTCECLPAQVEEPEIDYLAKDYQSFRQLVFDRMAVLVPDWTEKHAADLGVALVELLAYTGDYLSYYQDAVATEAYLETARKRISVRRHVRLVDYTLGEGCNSRAWLSIETSQNLELDVESTSFITGLNEALAARQTVLTWDDLRRVVPTKYEVFEPLMIDGSAKITLAAAHNEIHFYTWGERECCLRKGATKATFIDSWGPASTTAKESKTRALRLQPGDVLIFEEVLGPGTGLPADADPARRHAVRLTSVIPGEDPVLLTNNLPTPYVSVEWCADDALPFPMCLSTVSPAPSCALLVNVSVARGNVLLVDHGKTQESEDLGSVPSAGTHAECLCEGHPGDVQLRPGTFSPHLAQSPLTYSEPLSPQVLSKPSNVSAQALLRQDFRKSLPQVFLTSTPPAPWHAHYDLVSSAPDDPDYVVEIDDDGIANLRFGDGELGRRPAAGVSFQATYRVGNGRAGNVGAESISRLVLRGQKPSGVSVSLRNPLPATGGIDPEPISEAKLFAPHQFRKRMERAVIASDYAELAERNPRVQRAAAALKWTGSWYEADVAIDPLGSEEPGTEFLARIESWLECYRRIGHDVAVVPACYVSLDLGLEVCALPGYERARVKAALLEVFSNRQLAGTRLGFFHPDNLTFGEGVYLSRIVAVGQSVPGVECVRVVRLRRLFEPDNGEIENGVLPLRANEIARLDNDPNFPEHGQLDLQVMGGL